MSDSVSGQGQKVQACLGYWITTRKKINVNDGEKLLPIWAGPTGEK